MIIYLTHAELTRSEFARARAWEVKGQTDKAETLRDAMFADLPTSFTLLFVYREVGYYGRGVCTNIMFGIEHVATFRGMGRLKEVKV